MMSLLATPATYYVPDTMLIYNKKIATKDQLYNTSNLFFL